MRKCAEPLFGVLQSDELKQFKGRLAAQGNFMKHSSGVQIFHQIQHEQPVTQDLSLIHI